MCGLKYVLFWRIFHLNFRNKVYAVYVCWIQLIYHAVQVFYFLIDLLSVLPIIKSKVLIFPLFILEIFLISILSRLVLYTVLRNFYVWHIDDYNYCIFLVHWPFYYYTVPFFVCSNSFDLRSVLSDIGIKTSAFFWLLLALSIVSILSLST